jgi:hypothetical protein
VAELVVDNQAMEHQVRAMEALVATVFLQPQLLIRVAAETHHSGLFLEPQVQAVL